MTSLWFVTPAWRRLDLSAVCFEQRRRVMDKLSLGGMETHCVVVADDENLDIARGLGFETVERDNEFLGRKFNDGIEYAGTHGADYVVPIGSDSWIHSDYFAGVGRGTLTRTSHLYAVVEETRMAELRVATISGAGPYVLARSLLARSGFRPADDLLHKNVDSSTLNGIGQPIDWQHNDQMRLQYIGFRGTPHITSYDRLVTKWGVRERSDPWVRLAEVYPTDLVERARHALSPVAA